MTGQRTARLTLVLLLTTVIAASPPLEEFMPPVVPGMLQPVVMPVAPGMVSPQRIVPTSGVAELPVPSVSVKVRVPSEAAPGKELTYKLLVENCSKASAHHVTVKVTIPGSAARYVRAVPDPVETSPAFVWKLGTLAACAKREIVLVVMPTGDEEVSCCARVQFEHGQCVRTRIGKGVPAAPRPVVPSESEPSSPINRTPPLTSPPSKTPVDQEPPPNPPQPELEIRKLGPNEKAQYDIFNYKIEVRNVGGATAKNVIITDDLPSGITLLQSNPAESTQKPLTWNLGDLAAGAAKTIDYQVVAKETGSLKNVATVEAEGVAKREISHSIRIGQPALQVTMSGPKSRGVGRDTTYHLTVYNSGDIAATNVQLLNDLKGKDDSARANLQFVRASGGGRLAGDQVTWDLGTIAPGARRTVQLVLKARQAGTFTNVCTVSADRGLREQGKAETTFSILSGLAIEIEPERDSVEANRPTQIVVRVINAGKQNENNVSATIQLPAGLKFLDLPGLVGHVVQGSTITLPKRPLAAGTDAQIILSVQGEIAGEMNLGVSVSSDSITPDKAVKVEETITILPGTSSSRKYSSW